MPHPRQDAEVLALVAQALWGTFTAARYLRSQCWTVEEAVRLLTRSPL